MQAQLDLSTAMTVRVAAQFRSELISALASHHEVVLDTTAVEEADLSFVQIVYAARDEAERNEKLLRLAAPASGAVRALLERGGFVSAASPADLDFWFHGETPR